MSEGTRSNVTGSFARLLAEGIAVVASILIAFSLDAWWDNRGDAAALSAELHSIDEELAENIQLIGFQIDIMRRLIRGGDALIELAGVDPNAPVPDTLVWLAAATTTTLDMSLGAVDALLTSGSLHAIRTPALRVALAGLRDRTTDVREEQLMARELTLQIQARLDGTGVFAAMARISREFWGGDRVAGRPIPGHGMVEFRQGKDVLDMIRRRATWYSVSVAEMVAAQQRLEEMRSMIALELGVR